MFNYFSWFDNNEIQDFVSAFLSANPELQALNDDTKGNIARQIVGTIADVHKELVLGFYRCLVVA